MKIKEKLDNYSFGNNTQNFDYLIQASAVYSSNIEENSIDLNSYMNNKLLQQKTDEKRNTYYKNINLGVNYYELDYSQCLPFLTILPKELL